MSRIFHRNGLITRRIVFLTLGTGTAIFALVYSLDAFLAHIGLPAEATLIDDFLLGIVTASLVFVLELQHQLDRREQARKLAVVMQMNHHIRNALQAIVYVNDRNGDREAAEKIAAAAGRIEWALREVLTFERLETVQEERFEKWYR